jgi:cytochrome c oxidase assembly factor CtaG
MVQHVILGQVVPLMLVAMWRVRWRLPALLSWMIGITVVIGTSIPPIYHLATASTTVAWTIRAALVLSGVLFWNPVVGRIRRAQLSPGAALVYSITACFSTTLAGAYVAFSATTTDQQVAGLIMWVPCCMIYLSVTLAIVLRAMYGASSMASQQAN